VTANALQRRYPPGPNAYAVGCSDVELPNETFVAVPRPVQPDKRQFKLIFVGGLGQLYKAPEVLIAAVAANIRSGLDLRLTMAGDGKLRADLEQLAQQLGIHEHVRFAGLLPSGEAVRAELDQADLFVLPSRQEGLPRALVEAMARGLPCIASTVGGIPELLPPEDMVPPGDVAALAAKIREVLASRERLAQMAARNLQHARDYQADILRTRRRAFFEAVRDRTLEWQRRTGMPSEHSG
jgi:glycosyltransferase involved in cell wall biosynthesis